MIPYERHELIINTLQKSDLVKIDELQELMPSVSISTLRRDLKELEKQGRIEYLAGGAVKLHGTSREIAIVEKTSIMSSEKEKIAELAVAEIEDGDTIYVDSGSTCAALLTRLFSRRVTVYTTNASVLACQAETAADIIVVGGIFNPITSSLVGPITENILQELYFDKSFLGINAVDEERGAMTPNYAEATKKRIVRQNSGKTYLLCDSSKFHCFSNVKVFGLDGTTVISDCDDPKISERTRIIC